jgi:hypothetical protein
MLELLGNGFDKRATPTAAGTGHGVRRCVGTLSHYDWHLDRVPSAIRSATDPQKPAIADALAAAVTAAGGESGGAKPQGANMLK